MKATDHTKHPRNLLPKDRSRRRLLGIIAALVGVSAMAPLVGSAVRSDGEDERSEPRSRNRAPITPWQPLGPGSPREVPLVAANLRARHDLAG